MLSFGEESACAKVSTNAADRALRLLWTLSWAYVIAPCAGQPLLAKVCSSALLVIDAFRDMLVTLFRS